MKSRKLRIAWSVAWGIACAVIVVFWVRGHYRIEEVLAPVGRSTYLSAASFPNRFLFGVIDDSPTKSWSVASGSTDEYIAAFYLNTGGPPPLFAIQFGVINNDSIVTPCWFCLLVAATLSFAPRLRWRFSLRTLLIATALVAVVMGIIVWSIK